MPSVTQLSAAIGPHLIAPRPGPRVCRVCFNLTRGDFQRCYACAAGEQRLDAVIPISYSVAHEGLHTALADYKRRGDLAAHRDARQLAATLWRFLAQHEACVATAACAGAFDLVTTVPSGDRDRDRHHPLREIVSELVGPSRDRHARVLRRTTVAVEPRHFDPRRYSCDRALDGANVLLIDDTWTTGASAQSAAAALQAAGAGRVAAVVIGRHLNRAWGDNDRRLHALGEPFDWESCAACRREGLTLARAA